MPTTQGKIVRYLLIDSKFILKKSIIVLCPAHTNGYFVVDKEVGVKIVLCALTFGLIKKLLTTKNQSIYFCNS